MIKPISACATKRSDGDNGYYIQAETWGTCFMRRTTKRSDEIVVTWNRQPQFLHTYTKYPARWEANVWHVYLNYEPGQTPMFGYLEGLKVIGLDHPQGSGAWLNRSFLVYSPMGEPTVKWLPVGSVDESFYIETQDGEPRCFTIDTLMRGRIIQKIWLNGFGHHLTRAREYEQDEV